MSAEVPWYLNDRYYHHVHPICTVSIYIVYCSRNDNGIYSCTFSRKVLNKQRIQLGPRIFVDLLIPLLWDGNAKTTKKLATYSYRDGASEKCSRPLPNAYNCQGKEQYISNKASRYIHKDAWKKISNQNDKLNIYFCLSLVIHYH